MYLQSKKFRYPGAPPFSFDDRRIFFGREEILEKLYKFVTVEQIVVLISKSGLGKSSLLNAGLVPKFIESGNTQAYSVWFSSFRQKGDHLPLEILLDVINSSPIQETFLDKFEIGKESLWYKLKSYQLAENSDKGFLLIFDQFENFFTYPEESIIDFKHQLAEAINVKIPQDLFRAFHEKVLADPNFITPKEKEIFFKPLDIKVLFAIRSDKMNLLHGLKDSLPNILKKTFKLSPLNRFQAEDAIVSPAYLTDEEFVSNPFDFSDKALEKIIHFLTKEGELNEVESTQLQILCQYIEENIVIGQNKSLVDVDDLGNIEAIFSNYYSGIIEGLPESEQHKVRVFIEEGLIFEEDERRLPLDEKQIEKLFHVNNESLQYLVDKRLLRSSPNQTEGFSFELSHDTLVAPILMAKKQRLTLEAAVLKEEKRKEQEIELRNRKAAIRRKIIRRNRTILASVAIVIMAGIISILYFSQQKTNKLNEELSQKTDSLEILSNDLRILAQNAEQAKKQAIVSEKRAIEEATASKQRELVAIKEKVAEVTKKNLEIENSSKLLKEKVIELNRNEALDLIESAREEWEVKNFNRAKLLSLFALTHSNVLTPGEVSDIENKIKTIEDNPVSPFKTEFTQKMKYFSVSPNERWIASCGNQLNSIHVWEQSSGNNYCVLYGHDELINATSFNTNETLLASASDDKTVKIWDLETKQIIKTLNHEYPVLNVLFSPASTGNLMISATKNKIILWNTNNYNIIHEFTDVAADVNNMVFSNDGKLFAFVNTDNVAQIYNFGESDKTEKNGKDNPFIGSPVIVKGHSDYINCLAFAPDGKLIASGANDNKVVLSNTQTGKNQATLLDHTTKVTSLAFGPQGNFLASGDGSNTIIIWELSKLKTKSQDLKINTSNIQQQQELNSFNNTDQDKKLIPSIASLKNHQNKIVKLKFIGIPSNLNDSRAVQRLYKPETNIRLASLGNNERQIKFWEFPKKNTINYISYDSASMYSLIEKTKQQFNLSSSIGNQITITKTATEVLFDEVETTFDSKRQIELYDSILKINPSEYEAILGLGNAYYNSKKYKESAKYYKLFLEHFENDFKIWNMLGNVYYGDSAFNDAIKAYDKSISIYPDYFWPYLNKGLAFLELQKPDKAISVYKKALEINPQSPGAWNYIGNAYFQKKEYDSALVSYNKQIKIQPDYKWGWYNLAETYTLKKDTNNAFKYLKKTLEIDPYLRDGWLKLGNLYYGRKNYTDAANSYLEALNIDPNYINTYFSLGLVALNGPLDYAIKYFQKTNEIEDSYSEVWNALGIAWFKKGNYFESIKMYEKALSISPENPFSLANIAMSQSHSGNTNLARQTYEKILESSKVIDSTNYDIYALACIKIGDFQKARRYLKDADKYSTTNIYVNRTWACYFAENNQPEKALEYLYKTHSQGYFDFNWMKNEPALKNINASPGFLELIQQMQLTSEKIESNLREIFYRDEIITEIDDLSDTIDYEKTIEIFESNFSNLKNDEELNEAYLFTLEDFGYSLLDNGNFIKSANIFNKLLKTDPTYYEMDDLNELGNEFFYVNQDSIAKEYYLSVLKKDQTYYNTWANLGVIYERNGQTRKSIGAYKKSLIIKPDYIVALNGLGNVYLHEEKNDSANYYFSKAYKIDPSYRNNTAITILSNGDTTLAKNTFRNVVENDEFNKVALSYLVYLYDLEKNYDSLVYYTELQAKAEPDSSNYWGNLSWYYIFQNRYNDAILAGERAFQLNPNANWVKVNIGHAYLLQNNFDRAKTIYLEIKDIMWNKKTLREAILEDFKTLNDFGNKHPDMERMKRILTDN